MSPAEQQQNTALPNFSVENRKSFSTLDLIAALEPFATAAGGLNPDLPDNAIVDLRLNGNHTFYQVALGSLRHARVVIRAAHNALARDAGLLPALVEAHETLVEHLVHEAPLVIEAARAAIAKATGHE